MTSISSSFATVSRRQYVSAGVFNNNFFTYRTFLDANLETRGSLTTATSAANCPAGRILRETGKKLTGATHPDLEDPTTSTVYTFLVGVYDVTSGVNGFIDPNCPLFAPFTTDKTYQDNTTAEAIDASTGLQEVGPPVFTTGDVTTTTGRLILNTGNSGVAHLALGSIQGSYRKLTVLAAGCKTTSQVFLTYSGQNAPGFLSSEAIVNGSFQIVSSSTTDAGTVRWMVIN
jgi:hypothetical protein